MKNLYAFLIILTAFILITPSGYCEDKEVRIYFGNGVWNDEEDALNGQIALRKHLENVLITNDLKISWDISYNDTDGLYDLFEAAQQSAGLAWSDFWKALAGLNLLPDFLQDELKKIAVKFDEHLIKTYPSIQEHVKRYNKDLCEGKKVVVVAHSQGNLFANIAYKGINEDTIDGFGIVSVANPSWYVAGDSSDTYYTTIEEDKVIAVIPFALRANVDNFPDDNPDDLSGHMFVNSYLASGLKAESKILNDVVDKVYTLQWPDSCNIYALVSISNNTGEQFCFVWDIKSDQYAEIIDNHGDSVTFPISYAQISDWIATSQNVGSDLYSSSSGCGTSNIPVPDCTIAGLWGECTSTLTSPAGCPDIDGNTSLMNESVVWKSFKLEGGRLFERYLDATLPSYENSHVFSISNNTHGTTSCLIKSIAHHQVIDLNNGDQIHYVQGLPADKNIFEMITPLGSLGTWEMAGAYNEHNYNWPEYGNISGENSSTKLAGFQHVVKGKYSENALVQFFTLELQKKKTYRPCGEYPINGLWVGSPSYCDFKPCPVESDEITPLKEFKVVASADILEDGINQDPRSLNRNVTFENAIMKLYDQIKGNLSQPIPDYSFTLELLK